MYVELPIVPEEGMVPLGINAGRAVYRYLAGVRAGGQVGHGGPLAAGGRGERLEIKLAGHRDHANRQPAVDIGDQRLEDPLRLDAERVAGPQAIRAMPGVMLVLWLAVPDLALGVPLGWG